MYVDGPLLVNNNGLHGMVEKCGGIDLASGSHVVYIEGFQAGGGVGMVATYAGPDTGGKKKLMKSGTVFQQNGKKVLDGSFSTLNGYDSGSRATDDAEGGWAEESSGRLLLPAAGGSDEEYGDNADVGGNDDLADDVGGGSGGFADGAGLDGDGDRDADDSEAPATLDGDDGTSNEGET